MNRQLIALAGVLFLALGALRGAESAAAERLRAVKLQQVALTAREAKSEEWQALDREFAALAAEFPREAEVRAARGDFLWTRGEHRRAVAEWEAALQLAPDHPQVLQQVAASALENGDAPRAAALYARAVANDSGNAALRFALANVRFLFRHDLAKAEHRDAASVLDEALADFTEAARLAPENADYARAYAETYYSLPNPDWLAALKAWKAVVERSKDKDFARLNQARVFIKLGQPDAASACLNQIQNSDHQRLISVLRAQILAFQKASPPRTTPVPPAGAKISKPAIDGKPPPP